MYIPEFMIIYLAFVLVNSMQYNIKMCFGHEPLILLMIGYLSHGYISNRKKYISQHEYCSSAPHNYTKMRNILHHALRQAYHISKTFVMSSD